jgi:hypothetical protein
MIVDSYKGSMKIAATSDVVDAVFAVEDKSLRVVTGAEELGVWSLSDISVEDQGDGLFLNLAGEAVVVNVEDNDAFADAISPGNRRPGRTRRRKERDTKQRQPRDPVSREDRLARVRTLSDRDNWQGWLRDRSVRWSIASAGVIILALLALFATNTLGMILILLGMVGLIVAALAVSDDLSAYQIIPSAISETALIIAGAAAMGLGILFVVVG